MLPSRLPRRCNGTAEVLLSVSKVAGVWRSLSWCLESVMLWRGIMGCTKFGDKCVNDLDLLLSYVVGVACLHREKIHAGGSACTSPPLVLIIYSLPVVFVCNALFLFLLLYFHMYKPQTNLVNVCAQFISLRNEHFFGDTFDVLCFHMYKLQAYFENISVLRILLEKAMPWPHPRSAVFSYVQTPIKPQF